MELLNISILRCGNIKVRQRNWGGSRKYTTAPFHNLWAMPPWPRLLHLSNCPTNSVITLKAKLST